MEKQTHTAGPWRAAKSGYIFGPDVQVANVGDYKDRELLPFNKERWDADARLIAAAPELLAALRELTIAAEASGWDVDADNAPILNAARDAIARAEGGR